MTEPILYVQLATLAVLALTLWASKQMLEVNTRPQVECYLRSRPDKPNVFELAVANFGRGAAKNLEIELIGVDEEDFSAHSVQLSWRHTGPFTLLGPGESIASLFGFGPSLAGGDQEPLKPFKVRTSYRWTPFWHWRSNDVIEYYDMDVRPFQGIIPKWPKDEIAEILKKEMPNIIKAIKTRTRPPVQADTADIGHEALRRLELLMPELFSEMRTDLKDYPLRREFILMPKKAMYSSGGQSILAYFYEDHADLLEKVVILATSGAVIDITYNDVDRYLMTETLVTYLSETKSDAA